MILEKGYKSLSEISKKENLLKKKLCFNDVVGLYKNFQEIKSRVYVLNNNFHKIKIGFNTTYGCENWPKIYSSSSYIIFKFYENNNKRKTLLSPYLIECIYCSKLDIWKWSPLKIFFSNIP